MLTFPPMTHLQHQIVTLKATLDRLRPLVSDALRQLQHYYDVELTYTSNAIEGNTLTHRETAEIIAHGITVGSKKLKDHLEAMDHYAAVLWVREIAAETTPIGEETVRDLHRRIVARSEPGIAGSAVVFPNPLKLPELMAAFGAWLQTVPPTPEAAFETHFRLSAIHPFGDGNGRTARLLMNLLPLRAGYVPIVVRPEDRLVYLATLERGSLTGDLEPFQTLLQTRLAATLAEYLAALD